MSCVLDEYTFNADERPSFLSFTRSNLNDVWRYRWAIESFIAANLARRYRRSVLGFLWGLISPLMNMMVMAVVFSLIFHAEIRTFMVYVFTGLLPWSYMAESMTEGSQCFINAEQYLKKLSIPKLFFPIVSVGTDTCNFLFSLSALLVMALGLGVQLKATLVLLPLVIAVTAVFNLGLSILLGVLTVYMRDLTHIIRVTLPAFFYLIPIIYPMNAMPENYRFIFGWNPFYHFVGLYRNILYDGVMPSNREWVICAAVACLVFGAGLIVLRRRQQDLIYRL
jgi:ABC-type polysaccharide/polyol phosphate export permease